MKMKNLMLFILIAALLVGIATAPAANAPDMAQRAEELKSLRWGMFICWSFSTFSNQEYTPGIKDVAFFKPTGCDTEQWATVAKAAHMGYILFLTKHHDGFCLWDTRTPDRWFDTGAFVLPRNADGAYRYGNAGRGILNGDGFFNLDLSGFRRFKVTERWTLEFRAESFDFTNTPQYPNPDGGFGNATFGQVTSAAIGNSADAGSRQTNAGQLLYRSHKPPIGYFELPQTPPSLSWRRPAS